MDGRLAQVIIPAQVIDDQPNHIIGAMYGMIVMEARQVRAGVGAGIHYILWNARFPTMPLVSRETLADPRERIPWLDLKILADEVKGVFVAKWYEVSTGKELLSNAFQIHQPVEALAANTNAPEGVNGAT